MRRKWIWCDKRNELVPAEEFYQSKQLHYVIGDSQEFKVPGSDVVISGKRARREFMRKHGLEEVGNDHKGLQDECAKARRYTEESETRVLKSQLTEVLRAREFFRGR